MKLYVLAILCVVVAIAQGKKLYVIVVAEFASHVTCKLFHRLNQAKINKIRRLMFGYQILLS